MIGQAPMYLYAAMAAGALTAALNAYSIAWPLLITLGVYCLYFGVGLLILALNHQQYYALFVFSLAVLGLSAGWRLSEQLLKSRFNDSFKKFRTAPLLGTLRLNSVMLLFAVSLVLYVITFLRVGGLAVICPKLRVADELREFAELFSFVALCGVFVIAKTTGRIKDRAMFVTMLLVFVIINVVLLLSRNAVIELIFMLACLAFVLDELSVLKALAWAALALAVVLVGGMFRLYIYNTAACLNPTTTPLAIAAPAPESPSPILSLRRELRQAGNAVGTPNSLYRNLVYKRFVLVGGETLWFVFTAFGREYPYFHGLTYVRRLWNLAHPSRPIPSLGFLVYGQAIGSDKTRDQQAGYDPISVPGEFYANFGAAGVMLGMALLGMAASLLYASLFQRKTWLTLLTYAFGTMMLVRTFGYSLPGIAATAAAYGSAILLLWFKERRLAIGPPRLTSARQW
jgi:hypothetical protein